MSIKEYLLIVTEQHMTCIWHGHLGHMSRPCLVVEWKLHLVSATYPCYHFLIFLVCEHCQYGKQTRSVHQIRSDSSTQPLDLVHTDVCV